MLFIRDTLGNIRRFTGPYRNRFVTLNKACSIMIIIRPLVQQASGKLLAHLKTIGISAFYYDSAAALVVEEWIVGAAQKERFSRKNHDGELKKKEIN